MFKPHLGRCICHGKENIIVVKAGFCKRGNEEQKALKKADRNNRRPDLVKKELSHAEKIEKLKAMINKPRKATGELELFRKIWDEREHVCQVTGEIIRSFDINCFSHLLSKGAYGSLRLDPDNIWLVCKDIHHEWHTGSLQDPKWDRKKEARELLKQKYYQDKKL